MNYRYEINFGFDEQFTRTAKINGKIVAYDMADTGKYQEPKSFVIGPYLWLYIGAGVVWEVNGVQQNCKVAEHFWKKVVLSDLGGVGY